MLPHQYNRLNAPEGSPERIAAEEALSPENVASTVVKGLLPGLLGGFTGAHMPNVGAGYRPIAEFQALPAAVKRLQQQQIAQEMAAI